MSKHAEKLDARCLEYLLAHCEECAQQPSFLELPAEALARLLASDDLAMKEGRVLAVLRAWLEHDLAGRKGSLEQLVPLVRFPLLPPDARRTLVREPLLLHLMESASSRSLALQMVMECSLDLNLLDHEQRQAAASRFRWRGPGLRFTKFGPNDEYRPIADGKGVKATNADPEYMEAVCADYVMSCGKHCAEFTLTRASCVQVGLMSVSADLGDGTGIWYHWADTDLCLDSTLDPEGMVHFPAKEGLSEGDNVRMLLDMDAGLLTIKVNGNELGGCLKVTMRGGQCWAVAAGECWDEDDESEQEAPEDYTEVQIRALPWTEF